MKMNALMYLLILFVSGCAEKTNSIERLLDNSEIEIIQEFGEPKSTTTFILTDTLREYQYGLLEKYPNPNGKNIRIKELYWSTVNNKKLVIWLRKTNNKWKVVDNLTWQSDKIEF